MRIQYISHYDHDCNALQKRAYSPAGRDITAYVAGALAECGIETEVVSLACTKDTRLFYDAKSYDTPEGFRVSLPATFGGRGIAMKLVRNAWQIIQTYAVLPWRIRSGEAVLAYHSVSLARVLRWIKRLRKAKIILQVEEVYADVTPNAKYRAREYSMFAAADAFIVPTCSLGQVINSGNKPCVVLHGNYKAADRIARPLQDGKIHVVYAGTFDPAKGGAAGAIAAAQYLDERYVMHIIGFGTEEQTAVVEASVAESNRTSRCQVIYDGLKKGVEFTRYVQQCHIGLSTQNPEGQYNSTSFPSKVLMYMSNGLHVVSVNLPVLRESQVTDYIHYCADGRGESVAAAIRQVDLSKDTNVTSALKELNEDFQAAMKKLVEEYSYDS